VNGKIRFPFPHLFHLRESASISGWVPSDFPMIVAPVTSGFVVALSHATA
jgi:hypothetical protein